MRMCHASVGSVASESRGMTRNLAWMANPTVMTKRPSLTWTVRATELPSNQLAGDPRRCSATHRPVDDLHRERRESDPLEPLLELADGRSPVLAKCVGQDGHRKHQMTAGPNGGAEDVQTQHDVVPRHLRSAYGRQKLLTNVDNGNGRGPSRRSGKGL